MVHDIILGRTDKDLERYGTRGALLIGKQYITMGKTISMANRILLDVAKPHVLLIAGKRGSGKSYTIGVICEAMAAMPSDIARNLAAIIFDTMGIFWTMKYPNYRDEFLLEQWKIEPKGFDESTIVYAPEGLFKRFKDAGLPIDKPFSIATSEVGSMDWCSLFNVEVTSLIGILITRVITDFLEKGVPYDLDDVIKAVNADKRSDQPTRDAAVNFFETAKAWGLFTKHGSKTEDVVKRGQISIIDISGYAHMMTGFSIRALVIGLISKKILEERILARKTEEIVLIKEGYRGVEEALKEEKMAAIPQVWLFIDEAHEFLPRTGKTLSSDALIQVIREGRQPGVSLCLATQQPGKVHTDVITQSDIVISHRLTARIDIEALNQVMQTYLAGDILKYLNMLPSVRGTAIVLDDKLERMYPIQIRPRMSWHGGAEPETIPPEEEV